MPLLRLERLLCVRKFHGTQTKSDKPRESDGKLKEDGDCRNLIPTWLSSKLSAMLSTILWTRHDRRFTLNLSRITAVISESCFVFNQSQGDELLPNLHAPTFANDVGKYFVSKIDTIQRKIDADIIDLPASAFTTADGFNRSTPSLPAFKILSANSGKSLIHNSTLKSCPLDPMPLSLGQQMWCSSPRHYYDHWEIIRSRTLSQVLEGSTSMSVTQKAWSSYHTQEFQTGKQFGFLIEAHWESTLPSDARAHGRHESIPERSVSLQGAS